MLIGEYFIAPSLAIGVLLMLIGGICFFLRRKKITADKGSFINTGVNTGSVTIDNSQTTSNQKNSHDILTIIFGAASIIGCIIAVKSVL